MPDIPFPTVDIDRAASEINNALKDAAYIAVGLGVLGFQKAQVRRVELAKQLEGMPDNFGSQVDGYLREARRQGRTAGTRIADDLGDFSRFLDEALDPFRGQLLELAKAIEELLAPARQQVDERIDRFEQSLPERPRNVMQLFRESAAAREQAWRSLIGLDEAAPSESAETGTGQPHAAGPEPTASTEEDMPSTGQNPTTAFTEEDVPSTGQNPTPGDIL